ncbi:LRP chaperone MESD-like isoform X2 [Mya arenaria]|uniref:LRP chaperone MESD-like isoform X2 n=1 Tax=Mya arenaria TaxID=6604 RepID=UPI0022E8A48D|nr:LRP chaperone MESD-like isoform X2 [Mya arenaria]
MACPTFTLTLLCVLICVFQINDAKKDSPKKDEIKKKKDIRDFTDADMERLYDEWEDSDEDELPEDELPEWKREPPKIDMSNLDTKDPENILKNTKKGRTLMMFATVSGNPTQQETEKITQIWQGSLFNANIETQRYVVSENRVIFMLNNGAMAWEIKDFLVNQDRCEEVTIEGKSYPGKAYSGDPAATAEDEHKKDSKKNKKGKDKKSKESENDKKEKEITDNRTTKDKKKKEKTEL